MAANKAKRSIHLAQPVRPSLHPDPRSDASELMPVKAHAYRTLAELNAGFEKVLQDLKTLGHISFFNSGHATAAHNRISMIRAEVNREFAQTLADRETANAAHFLRLSAVPD